MHAGLCRTPEPSYHLSFFQSPRRHQTESSLSLNQIPRHPWASQSLLVETVSPLTSATLLVLPTGHRSSSLPAGPHSLALGTVFLPAKCWTKSTKSSLGQMKNLTFRCQFLPSYPRSYFPWYRSHKDRLCLECWLRDSPGRNKAGGRKSWGPPTPVTDCWQPTGHMGRKGVCRSSLTHVAPMALKVKNKKCDSVFWHLEMKRT